MYKGKCLYHVEVHRRTESFPSLPLAYSVQPLGYSVQPLAHSVGPLIWFSSAQVNSEQLRRERANKKKNFRPGWKHLHNTITGSLQWLIWQLGKGSFPTFHRPQGHQSSIEDTAGDRRLERRCHEIFPNGLHPGAEDAFHTKCSWDGTRAWFWRIRLGLGVSR